MPLLPRFDAEQIAAVGEQVLGFPVRWITCNFELRLVEEALQTQKGQ